MTRTYAWRLVGLSLAAALSAQVAHAQSTAAGGYASAWDEYQALKARAHGGSKMTWDKLPDWSGVWYRDSGFNQSFDPRDARGVRSTAPLTPEYAARYDKKLAAPHSGRPGNVFGVCLPKGFPGFLALPYSREFVVRPDYVLWVLETNNEVRRIYLDDRPHVAEELAEPEVEGDSIGFWDGDTLVVHTNHLNGGEYQGDQPDFSDQISTVEKIHSVDPDTIEDDVAVYDPPSLSKPWHVVDRYKKITNVPDMRLNYWPCVQQLLDAKPPEPAPHPVDSAKSH